MGADRDGAIGRAMDGIMDGAIGRVMDGVMDGAIGRAMDRAERVRCHPALQRSLEAVCKAEEGRIFCGHGLGHLLDVARIAYILNLEEHLGIRRDVVYAAALLHDSGKAEQYRLGIPHERTGAALAREILGECGYTPSEQEAIAAAIGAHRDWEAARRSPLGSILYRADKLSRPCFACQAEPECDWVTDKKNLHVRY